MNFLTPLIKESIDNDITKEGQLNWFIEEVNRLNNGKVFVKRDIMYERRFSLKF